MTEIIAAICVKLGAMFLTWATAQIAKKRDEALTEEESLKRADAVKAALNEALDGQPVTKDQRAKLNSAFSALVHGSKPSV